MLLSQPKCGPSLHYFPSVAVRTLRACQCLVWGAVGVFLRGGCMVARWVAWVLTSLTTTICLYFHVWLQRACVGCLLQPFAQPTLLWLWLLALATALCVAMPHLAVAVAISQLATALCAAMPHLAMAGANSAVSTQAICVQCWLRVHVGTARCCIPGCVHGAATARCSFVSMSSTTLTLAPGANIVPIAQASTVQWKLV
jgi:hypothetical protein